MADTGRVGSAETGSRASHRANSSVVSTKGFDPARIRLAQEAWDRILNMDGGQPQAIAAGMWASIYADVLLKAATQSTGETKEEPQS